MVVKIFKEKEEMIQEQRAIMTRFEEQERLIKELEEIIRKRFKDKE